MFMQEDFKLVSVLPVLDDNQLDQAVKPILQEYLEHGNTCEVEVIGEFILFRETSQSEDVD